MMARIRKAMKEEQGFTLIELLVVMIIIGILAAIAIPIFLSQREKAQDSAARADVSTIGKEVATYFVDGDSVAGLAVAINNGRYELSGGDLTEAQDLGAASANNVISDQSFTSATNWCVEISNEEGDVAVNGVSYSAQSGLQDTPCSGGGGTT